MVLNAESLLARFAVYGRFYEKEIAGEPEFLRDRLEIGPRGMALDELVTREPDLLVVMMNPGGSRPLGAMWDEASTHGFVAAVPDRTQYQIMRLLVATETMAFAWRHARILNLSDLRTPKSGDFLKKLQRYYQDDTHSLFCDARRCERDALFAVAKTPVLLGWGLNAAFETWAQRARDAVGLHPILGLTENGLLYRHPLPQRHDFQVQWLNDVLMQVRQLQGQMADIYGDRVQESRQAKKFVA